MAALMDLSPSLVEERPTKNRPAQHIGGRITITKTVSRLDYPIAAVTTSDSRHGEVQKVEVSAKRN